MYIPELANLDSPDIWLCKDVQWCQHWEFPETYHESGINSGGFTGTGTDSHSTCPSRRSRRPCREYQSQNGRTRSQNVVIQNPEYRMNKLYLREIPVPSPSLRYSPFPSRMHDLHNLRNNSRKAPPGVGFFLNHHKASFPVNIVTSRELTFNNFLLSGMRFHVRYTASLTPLQVTRK
jgi:hypothetical protein